MILCIDAGNSRVKWGWHDGREWTSIATVSPFMKTDAASSSLIPSGSLAAHAVGTTAAEA